MIGWDKTIGIYLQEEYNFWDLQEVFSFLIEKESNFWTGWPLNVPPPGPQDFDLGTFECSRSYNSIVQDMGGVFAYPISSFDLKFLWDFIFRYCGINLLLIAY